MKKYSVLGLVSLLTLLIFVSPVLADAPGVVDTTNDVMTVINNIANWMFTIFMAVAVMMIVYAAFIYLTANGGEKVQQAHKVLIYSVIGIAVAILAKGIVNVVESILASGT